MRATAPPLSFTLISLVLAVALAGCSVVGHKSTEPKRVPSGSNVPQVPPDVLDVPDAVPRAEPRGRRGNPPFYEVFGKRYHVMAGSEGWVERGTASWYGPGFHNATTSLGEPYDMYAMTAAHKTLPIPVYAEVTNLRNGRKVVVRINDRGPFIGDRIIDLSYTAAAKLDMLTAGTAPVEVRVITPGRTTATAGSGSARPPVLPASPAPGPITAPPPAPASPPAPPSVTVVNAAAAQSAQAMFIQAGVFSDHENARRRVESLLAGGVELASLEGLVAGQRALHRVVVGPFTSIEEFDLNLKRVRELGVPDARLLTP
jgi:rare lipoprotein A